MNILSSIQQSKLTDVLLLNAHTLNDISFPFGKAGIALTLFELAEFNKGDNLSEHAFALLQEVLVYKTNQCDFEQGKAGIGFALNYIIESQFIDADFLELYEEQHLEIVEYIKHISYNENKVYSHIDFLFYLEELSKHIKKKDFIESQENLIQNLFLWLDSTLENIKLQNSNQFFIQASKLISIFPYVNFSNKVVTQLKNKIIDVDNKLTDFDCVFSNTLYSLRFYLLLKGEEDTYKFAETQKFKNRLKDIIIPHLSFKEKIDLLYILHREQYVDIDNKEKLILNIINSFVNEEILLFEEKILHNVITNNNNFGVHHGLSRLLLLDVYSQKGYNSSISKLLL